MSQNLVQMEDGVSQTKTTRATDVNVSARIVVLNQVIIQARFHNIKYHTNAHVALRCYLLRHVRVR